MAATHNRSTHTSLYVSFLISLVLQKLAIEKAKAGGGMRPSERRAQQMLQQGSGGYGDQPNGAAPYEGRGGGRGGYSDREPRNYDYGNTRSRPEPAAGGYQASSQYR